MKICETIESLREEVRAARGAGKTIGFVPTMGALHAGHASLIDAAAEDCDFVVVSIFVNPTQFGPNEDLAAYPRTPEKDAELCRKHGASAIFMPTPAEMYPPVEEHASAEKRGSMAPLTWAPLTKVSVAALSGNLCGASRPGHFDGVCLVVAKLFNIVLPDKAFFGAKDFQQATIIRRIAADLNFPLEIVVCPTVREADGLAMSSRNAYLSPQERAQAPALHQALQAARQEILKSHPTAAAVIDAIRRHIAQHASLGTVDYVQVVDAQSLCDVESTNRPVAIALAVKFGRARLIDNVVVE